MATDDERVEPQGNGKRRLTLWAIAIVGLLMLPAVAMQFTSGVNWTGTDFIAALILLLGLAVPIEMAMRSGQGLAYKAGAALTVIGAFLVTWSNLAVGIIGDEGNPLNLMFFAVIALGLAGCALAHFRAAGMAWAVGAMATGQAIIAVLTLAFSWSSSEPAGSGLVAFLIGSFAGLWAVAAGLFRRAARST